MDNNEELKQRCKELEELVAKQEEQIKELEQKVATYKLNSVLLKDALEERF